MRYLFGALFTAYLTFLTRPWHAQGHPTQLAGVSIPLTPASNTRNLSPFPPTIVHQQHANRGIKRLELMMGRDYTSDRDLISNIQKRASVLPQDLQKRYYSGLTEALAQLTQVGTNPDLDRTADQSFATGEGGEGEDGDPPKHGSLTKAKKPTYPNTIGLDIQAKDVGYIGTVRIGTPLRDFHLLMDSGSADLWVGGEGCQDGNGDECDGGHKFLGPKSSSSFNDTKKPWTIQYGTGAVTGHIVHDHVSIAGLKLKSFKFGIALTESDDFTSDYIPFDGLVGLAKSAISRQGTVTLVESLQHAGHIKHAITSYKIPRLADGKNDGEMTLGAMNPAKYNSKALVTVPNINPIGFWEAAIGKIKVNGKDMGWKNRTAILDTGTTLIIAPQPDVDAIHKGIPGAHFDGTDWTIPCTTKATFSLTIGDREFAVDSRDLTFLPTDPDNPKGNCTSSFAAGSIGADNQWLVGDVFLKNVYMSTNVEKNDITLAKLAK